MTGPADIYLDRTIQNPDDTYRPSGLAPLRCIMAGEFMDSR